MELKTGQTEEVRQILKMVFEIDFNAMDDSLFKTKQYKLGALFQNDRFLCKVLICPSDIIIDAVESKGLTFEELDYKDARCEDNFFITDSFWTCKCKSFFVKSRLVSECPKCGCIITENTKKLPYIRKSTFDWESFLIDAGTYKVPEDFKNV